MMIKTRCEDVKLLALKNEEEGHGPRNVSSHQKLQKARKDSFPRVFRERVPIDTLILDFWLFEM